MSKKDKEVSESLARKRKWYVALLILLFVIFLIFDIFFIYYLIFNNSSRSNIVIDNSPASTASNGNSMEASSDEPKSVESETTFFDEIVIIDGQVAYISGIEQIDSENPPSIVIYSHGSNTRVVDDPENRFMKDLQEYARVFAPAGYIFAASNQHGENWGNEASVRDTRLLYEYVVTNYETDGNLFLVGYSMGGLPTLNYSFKYPEELNSIALIAPTSYPFTYQESQFSAVQDIDIKIWHGNRDVNVPLKMSQDLKARAALFEKEIELVTLEGVDHWQIERAVLADILSFFGG